MPNDTRPPALTSPFADYLARLHQELKGLTAGQVADYIPELARARPESFALAFATVDGHVYTAGDAETPFSIQSISKPFMYGDALRRLGMERLLTKVGVEPTGEAFNSIVLDQKNNRPFNPMVNAGAIAVSALVDGATQAERTEAMRRVFEEFAGRPLEIDEPVFRSELETGHRNRAIAYLMLNTGMLERDPEEVLEIYFRQCAVRVTCADLAVMGAVLANNGINPLTGAEVLRPENVRDVLTLMLSCGMYDYAGEWSYEVGLPAKSGVSGGVLAVLPGQLSIAVWSPPLDEIGNSIRGVAACRRISEDFGLHMFMNAASVEDVVRREMRANQLSSLRIRNPRERDILAAEGHRIAVVELQGALYFASAERLVRHVERIAPEIGFLILDFRRLHAVDAAAGRFLQEMVHKIQARGIEIAFAEVGTPGTGGPGTVPALIGSLAEGTGIAVHLNADSALEHFEEKLLEDRREPFDSTRFSLEEIELFAGIDRAGLKLLESEIQSMQFTAGETILRKGDPGRLFFVIARGSVSVVLPTEQGPGLRIGCLGPGQFFGEMAVLEGGTRSADVVADEPVICYGLAVDRLFEMGAEHPEIVTCLLKNMAREFSSRLRRGHAVIEALQ